MGISPQIGPTVTVHSSHNAHYAVVSAHEATVNDDDHGKLHQRNQLLQTKMFNRKGSQGYLTKASTSSCISSTILLTVVIRSMPLGENAFLVHQNDKKGAYSLMFAVSSQRRCPHANQQIRIDLFVLVHFC